MNDPTTTRLVNQLAEERKPVVRKVCTVTDEDGFAFAKGKKMALNVCYVHAVDDVEIPLSSIPVTLYFEDEYIGWMIMRAEIDAPLDSFGVVGIKPPIVDKARMRNFPRTSWALVEYEIKEVVQRKREGSE